MLTPVLVAGFLTALVAPLYFWLQKHGLSSRLSIIIIIVLMIAAVVGLAALLGLSADRLLDGLAGYEDELSGIESEAAQVLTQLGITEESVSDAMTGEKLASLLAAILVGSCCSPETCFLDWVLVCFLLMDFKRLLTMATTELSGRPFFSQLPAMAKTAVTYFGNRTEAELHDRCRRDHRIAATGRGLRLPVGRHGLCA